MHLLKVSLLTSYKRYHLSTMHKLSLSKKIIDIRKMFLWKQRKLTLNGKVLILKSLAISQIIYLASLRSFPEDLTPEIEQNDM